MFSRPHDIEIRIAPITLYIKKLSYILIFTPPVTILISFM